MRKHIRTKVEFLAALLVFCGFAAAGWGVRCYVESLEDKGAMETASKQVETTGNLVVLDAGHGGGDSGKVGEGNILEKDINLAIAKKVKVKLEESGIKAVMTREKDELLSGDAKDNKKIADLKNRVKIINEEKPQLAVSIHQNSYPDPDVKGAQVFYFSHSAEAKEAAETMQEALLACDPDNTRKAKGNETYYLLKRTEVPTIIVECGFLSSPEEAALLTKEDYQQKLSEAIVKGIQSCLVK